MFASITEVKPLPELTLWLRFDDGDSGEVNLKERLKFSGVFAKLRDPHEFAKVSLDPEVGVVCWPNGADLDTEVLYSLVSGKPIVFEQPPV